MAATVLRVVREPAWVGAVLVALAIVAFAVGRASRHGGWDPDGALDVVHEGGQLVALNASDRGSSGPEGETWERVARVLSVLAFAAFGFEVLRTISGSAVERLRVLWRRWMPGLRGRRRVSVLGSGPRADWLAREIAALPGRDGKGQALVTQVCPEPAGGRPALGPLLVASRPAIDRASLESLDVDRADEVVVMADDDAEALTRLNAVLGLPDRRPAGAAARTVRVELRTPEVREQVRSADWDRETARADGREGRGQWDVRVWSADENAARHALRSARLDWRHPFSRPGGRTELIAIGFGGAGRVLAAGMLRTAHHVDEVPCRITVIDVDAARSIARFRASFPHVDRIAVIESHALDGFDPAVRAMVTERMRDASVNVVLSVSVGDLDGNLSIALGIARSLADGEPGQASARRGDAMPVFVRQSGLADVHGVFERLRPAGQLGAVDLHPWGSLDDACHPEDVLESRLDLRARRIHGAYLSRYPAKAADLADPLSANRPWGELWSFFRDDNRNRADFLEARLRSVGLRIVSGDPAPDAAVILGEDEREALARLEHRRWTVSRIMAGWSRGTRNLAARRHPSICPWAELSGSERAKDEVALDLEANLFPGERLARG